jgi:hypothetical protein
MKKKWDLQAKIYIDETLFATIRKCDNEYCFNASKAISIDNKTLKRIRTNDFASFDTAHNELKTYLKNEYQIDEKRIFRERS